MKDASCIVVGGAGGMGVQICRQLLENQITFCLFFVKSIPVQNLAIVDIQPMPTDLLDDLKMRNHDTQVIFFQCDISIKDELQATFNSIASIFRSVDILINAAGIFNDKNIELTFKVNVFGLIYSTMFGIQLMNKEKRNGRNDAVIINIASLVGLDPLHLLPVYTASKHAIVGFSRAYSHESYYALNGVKIIVLCPGATTTTFAKQFLGNMISPNENDALEAFRSTPKQSSEQVAEHIIKLIGSAANGSIWLSDNGQLTEVTMTTYCSSLTSESS